VISCNSLLEELSEPIVDDTPADVSWPTIIHGIRVYANRQPSKVAADLFELADLFRGIAELQADESAI
jgi:hypothetical protein